MATQRSANTCRSRTAEAAADKLVRRPRRDSQPPPHKYRYTTKHTLHTATATRQRCYRCSPQQLRTLHTLALHNKPTQHVSAKTATQYLNATTRQPQQNKTQLPPHKTLHIHCHATATQQPLHNIATTHSLSSTATSYNRITTTTHNNCAQPTNTKTRNKKMQRTNLTQQLQNHCNPITQSAPHNNSEHNN